VASSMPLKTALFLEGPLERLKKWATTSRRLCLESGGGFLVGKVKQQSVHRIFGWRAKL